MATRGVLLAVLATWVTVVVHGQANAPTPSSEEARTSVLRALNAFSTDLYKRAGRASEGNLVLSPLSAGLLLALTWEGSAGGTARELSRALRLPEDRQLVALGSKGLISSIQRSPAETLAMLFGDGDKSPASPLSGEVVLRLANKLYAQRGFRLKDDFREKASNFFEADAEELDFARDSEDARRVINSWVEEYTASKIKDLFPKGSPSSSSRLVLVNAVYLKAAWLKPFEKTATKMRPFYLPSRSVNVPMMWKKSELLFANIPDFSAKALQLPLEDGPGLKMVFILPDSVDGLPQLEANLEHVNVNAIPWEERTVTLSLPKFHIEATHNLVEQLRELGVKDPFTTNANLTGIANGGLYVSNALQKTFIDVNENGVEASAASGVDFVKLSLPPAPAVFYADHPFLFFIIKQEAIVFLGRVTDPLPK